MSEKIPTVEDEPYFDPCYIAYGRIGKQYIAWTGPLSIYVNHIEDESGVDLEYITRKEFLRATLPLERNPREPKL